MIDGWMDGWECGNPYREQPNKGKEEEQLFSGFTRLRSCSSGSKVGAISSTVVSSYHLVSYKKEETVSLTLSKLACKMSKHLTISPKCTITLLSVQGINTHNIL